jgi:hypothetical protein
MVVLLGFAEDVGGGFAAGVAVAGVCREVAGEVHEAEPGGDLGLGADDGEAGFGDALDVGRGEMEVGAGEDVGELAEADAVAVAEAEGVVVGVVGVGEDVGGVGGRGLGRGRGGGG